MEAGKLDRRITVERFTMVEDDFGGETQTWAPLATVPAQVTPVSDVERVRAAEAGAVITTRFLIRWGLGVTVEDRIVYEGRVFDIWGTKETGRRDGQELSAAARAETTS